ncbi:MAG: crossover junction endodeoxyribonuclease RuvC [Patescibacteria group bacterium]|nr:crossover junction endodeoxyribonuclease RuvC [Patescibacteria group bacterium]
MSRTSTTTPSPADPPVVLGIDPGIGTTGYGALAVERNALTVRAFGVIRTPPRTPDADRLAQLERAIDDLIARFRPRALAIEKLFFNTNTTTAMAVSQARGAILAAAGRANVFVREFTPLQVKLAVAGYGRADKGQMQRMVMLQLKLKEPPRPDDAADALALAICGAYGGHLVAGAPRLVG